MNLDGKSRKQSKEDYLKQFHLLKIFLPLLK